MHSLCGNALTYSYISFAQFDITTVFCASSSRLVNSSSSSASRASCSSNPRATPAPFPARGPPNICARRGDAAIGSNWYDDGRRRPPRRMPVAMLSARVRALPFARALALEGEEESGGRLVLGGGGNVGAGLGGEPDVGESRPTPEGSSMRGEGLRSRSGFRRAVISRFRVRQVTRNESLPDAPSTARLISTACRSLTRTYSRRSSPSSSVSPGISDVSGDNGFVLAAGLNCGDCAGGERDGPGRFSAALSRHVKFLHINCSNSTHTLYTTCSCAPTEARRLNLIFAGGIMAFGSRTSGGMTKW